MNEFLDSYKQLEKLCNEIYNQNNGVSQYISDMESRSGFNTTYVPGWDRDYRRLKEIRHIRNSMVHDTTDDGTNYSDEDVKFLQDFYERLMSGSDPITMLRMYDQSIEFHSKPQQRPVMQKPVDVGRVHNFNSNIDDRKPKKRRKGVVGGIVGIIFFLGLLILLLVIVINKSGIFI